MIRSMTAYARREIKGSWGSATWEMRSVNQRYLETYFRMPEQFRSLEPVVRLVAKLEEAEVQLENNRLEQELVLMAQRVDVAEELDRLEAHVKETYNILKKKEAVGRRLDFMMQEFNRESNTLASKSINADVTNSAIELKVLIEQMREQIQNIE